MSDDFEAAWSAVRMKEITISSREGAVNRAATYSELKALAQYVAEENAKLREEIENLKHTDPFSYLRGRV